jgi:dihydrofolate synthase/folylpolyglutamate synthase
VCTAIAVSRNLKKYKIYESHINKAITKIRSEGRLQNITHGKLRNYVCKDNEILVDGAHNTLAALQIKKYLKNLNKRKKIILMLGMMSNKDHKRFIKTLKNVIDSIIVLDIPNQINAIKKEKLSKIALSCGIPTKIADSITSAFKSISKKDNNAIIFCTGSLYFAGEILNLN